MRVYVTTEHRFVESSDGHYYSDTGGRGYSFWCRYLEAFDEVVVVARVRRVAQPPAGGGQADGDRVRFLALPDFRGLGGLLRARREVSRNLRMAVDPGAAYMLRIPGAVGSLLAHELARQHIGYGVEVVGDPAGVFSLGAFKHPLRQVIRARAVRNMKSLCMGAIAASYVTKHALQEAYPAAAGVPVANYSSVELDASAFVPCGRRYTLKNLQAQFRLVSVGTLSQRHKGMDTLIDAVGRCVREGLGITLEIVGDGQYREELENLVVQHGLEGRVTFAGLVPAGKAVQERLDRADLFVMASRTEGLPRAMIEAMARGLPCIGTNVGGIPELLRPEEMVERDDPAALGRKIAGIAVDPDRLTRLSAYNLDIAREYRSDLLQERRAEFYRTLRRRTEEMSAR